jgi:DNA-binding transcriptional LysR family regulator
LLLLVAAAFALVDLSELNVFLMVARERSFSRAAQKLYRTQPAVSITIRKLEDEVGEPLFARGARSGQLTDAGRLLVGYAERILNLRDEIRRAVDDLRSGGRGELSLGVNESSIHALLPVLARYRQLFPEVHLAVRRTFSRDIPTELLNYRLDLGVASFVPQEPQLASVKIFRDELALVVSPKHRLARRGRAELAELGAENFVAHIVESPFRQRVIQLFAKHHVPLRMNIELPTIESIKRFVQMDIGVAIVPRMCVRFEIEQGLLVEVKVRELRMPRDLYLLYRRREPLSHSAKAMFELLKPRGASNTHDAASAHESADS